MFKVSSIQYTKIGETPASPHFIFSLMAPLRLGGSKRTYAEYAEPNPATDW